MDIKLYNTAKRAKETLKTVDPSGRKVGMYVCGPTVYDFIHIGNARPLVVFDTLFRLLQSRFDTVTYVRNITDVDDKINARAKERGEDIRTLTDRTIEQFHEDTRALGCLSPTVEPRATDHIAEMLDMIGRLVENGHAYAADGHVLFSVPSWAEYGRFANKDRDEQVAGARVEVAPYKRDPADFVLWKPSGEGQPGWDSPWGRGRPGWHIECSAMSEKHLGMDFDIHGGGLDLIFPHHQNEIAQSCCANPGHGFARLWMHNGYLLSEGEKMSKSLGNFYTVRELLEEFPGEALRLVILQTHYRQPLDFSKDKCREAKATLDRMYGALKDMGDLSEGKADEAVIEALADDLNTPSALSVLHKLVAAVNQADDAQARREAAARLKSSGALLGLLQNSPEEWFKGGTDVDAAEIESLIAARVAAKKAKDFALADKIRDDLKERGILLEDKPGGVTEWRKA